MTQSLLPLVVEPEQLEALLGSPNLVVIDLGKSTTYQEMHIPGAQFLDYNAILANRGKTMGLLPSPEVLTPLFSSLGINEDIHVVAYDDEGGGKAGRLIWTLEAMGHNQCSLLNGGLHSWANEAHPLTREVPTANHRQFIANPTDRGIADAEYILSKLGDDKTQLLDARSTAEYQGVKRFANKAGHIPGAINMDWVLALDQSRNLRLKSKQELTELLHNLCINPENEVIVYCHTHHRSSLSYIMLRYLGYEHVKGYPGSWSDWGNRTDTPIA